MITHEDQLNLLRLVAARMVRNITCYAFGGNAMMFYGYKEETKDIDLLFETNLDRKTFTDSIKSLGFAEHSPMSIYIPEKLRDKSKPIMFRRQDYRMDLFAGKIFRTQLSPTMKKDLFAVHEFMEKKYLKVNVLRKEHIVLLKGITDRDKDLTDILIILQNEKNFDWQYLIDEVIWQHKHGDSWAILDTEKMMQEIKKYVFVEKKYLDQLYAAKKSASGR
ncbi:MAG: hypothetical protein ABIF10_02535 [Candidatus Woesearchaeota archaeon]